MERKQIYLASEQVDELDRVAAARKVPVSLVIRDAIAEYLVNLDEPMLDSAEEHPLWGIVGMVQQANVPAQGAASHDEVLYKHRRRR